MVFNIWSNGKTNIHYWIVNDTVNSALLISICGNSVSKKCGIKSGIDGIPLDKFGIDI